MKYLKIWTSFREVIRPLDDAEAGRLFRMMLAYAETGEEPERFEGNERFLWPVTRQQIDLTIEKAGVLRVNGLKGGRPKAAGMTMETKENQTEANETRPNQTEADESRNNKVKKSKVNIESVCEADFAVFWSEYPNRVKKQDALKAWRQVYLPEEMPGIMEGLKRWKRSDQWTRDGGRYVPYPATWLRARQWEDEVHAGGAGRTVAAQEYGQREYSADDSPEATMDRLMRMMGGTGA